MKSFLGGSLLGVWLIFFFTGCGGGAPATEQPESFIFARGADAAMLDPANIDDGESVNTLLQMLEGLMAFKEASLEIEPRLAESYTISDDGLTYTFVLREGITFHDGTPLNAETAAFTFQRQLEPDHPARFPDSTFQYWSNLFGAVESLEVQPPRTLAFHLKEPNAALIYAFATFPAFLISPNALETYGADMVFHPVGTGPYQFERWQPGEAVTMTRWEGYWREPAAGFDRLVMRSIPQNQQRVAELLAGTVHALDGLQPAELAALGADERFVVQHQPGLNVGYLSFSNLADVTVPPEARRAIAMAIDREALVRLALDAYGTVAKYPMPPGFLGEKAGPEPIVYDPEAAREALAAYPELLERGLTLAAFGEPRMYFPDPMRIASLIRADLEAVGLPVEIVNRDFKSHLHITRRGEYEMAILGWIADTPDPSNFLDTFMHSRAAVPGSATNIAFYRNPAMDALLEEAVRVTDVAQREQLYGQALDLWIEDLPLIPLVHGEQITVLRKEVTGYKLHPAGNHFFGPVGWQIKE